MCWVHLSLPTSQFLCISIPETSFTRDPEKTNRHTFFVVFQLVLQERDNKVEFINDITLANQF